MIVLFDWLAARRPAGGARGVLVAMFGLVGCNGLAPDGPPPPTGAIASGAARARGAYVAGGATPAPRRDPTGPGEPSLAPAPPASTGGGGAGGEDPGAPTPTVPQGTGDGLAL